MWYDYFYEIMKFVNMKRVYIILLFVIELIHNGAASDCLPAAITLTQSIQNEGFHRELHWLLERQDVNCSLALKLEMKKETYINPDEIADLNRMGLLSAHVDEDVDIESVAHLSVPHSIYIFIENGKAKVTLNLPFHLRYQRSQISGGYAKAVINKPSILVMCENPCTKNVVNAVCNARGMDWCLWKNVTYRALFDETELLVPVGNLDDYPLVAIVTLLLGCAGCIYTLSVLSTTAL